MIHPSSSQNLKCTSLCSVLEILELYAQDILQFRFSRGAPIRFLGSVKPISAGLYSDGRKAFAADAFASFDCAVTENTYPEKPCVWDWNDDGFVIPDFVYLPVLRYEADKYPRRHGTEEFMAGIDDGLDATGPYSWRFVKHLSHIEQIS